MHSLTILLSTCILANAACCIQTPRLAVSRSALSMERALQLRGGSNLEFLSSEEELDLELDAAGSALVLVDFTAEWCGPCKKLAPVLDALAAKHEPSGKVKFFAVDVDKARELAAAQGVKSMPTIKFFRNGKLVTTVVGADIARIKAEIEKVTLNPLMALFKSEKLIVAAALAYCGATLTPLGRILGLPQLA